MLLLGQMTLLTSDTEQRLERCKFESGFFLKFISEFSPKFDSGTLLKFESGFLLKFETGFFLKHSFLLHHR